MIFSFALIFDWILQYRYFILFPLVFVEGPIITIIAGFLSSLDILNIFIIYPVVVGADVSADIIYYLIGRFGRERFVKKWGKYIGINKSRVLRLEKLFEKHTKKALIAGKISHGIGTPILVAAGIVAVPIWEFIWINIIGTLIKTFILLLVGYYFGQAYVQLNKYLDYIAIGFTMLAILVIVSYFVYKKIKPRYDKFMNKIETA